MSIASRKHDFINFYHLKCVMKRQHISYFHSLSEECKGLPFSVFDIFLNVIRVEPQDVMRIELIDSSIVQIEEENAISNETTNQADVEILEGVEVEGDGEVLVDRSVIDENEYKSTFNQLNRTRGMKRKNEEHAIQDKYGI